MVEPIPRNEAAPPPAPPARRAWSLRLALAGGLSLACGLCLLAALLAAGPSAVNSLLGDPLRIAEERGRDRTQANSMGEADAPVRIIEYGDFQCAYCVEFWRETEPRIIERYVNTGQVHFEYRAYPVLGPESNRAAEAAYCAGDQGRFWEYHDLLFENWSGENTGTYARENLIRYAGAAGLDPEAFAACLDSGRHTPTVEADLAQAKADGVRATPTFLINGERVEGAQPFRIFEHLIEQILNGDLERLSG